MDAADLARFVALHRARLEQLGVEELRFVCDTDMLGMTGRVREGGQAAELTARLHLDARRARLRVACGRAVVFGYLPTPAQHALGGYETWRARSSFLEVNASVKIEKTINELMSDLAK